MSVVLHIILNSSSIELPVEEKNITAVNYNIKDFTKLAAAKNNLSYYSWDIEILGNEENNRKLKYAASINSMNGDDLRGIELSAILERDSFATKGTFKITDYKVEKNVLKYRGQFLGGLTNWIKSLPNYIDELDLGEYEFSSKNVVATFKDGEPYNYHEEVWFALKYYGRYEEVTYVKQEEMYPDVYLGAIVQAMSIYSAIPIRSHFFASEYFRRWLHFYTGNGLFRAKIFEAELTTSQGINTDYFDFENTWSVIFNPREITPSPRNDLVIRPVVERFILEGVIDVNIPNGSTHKLEVIDEFLNPIASQLLINGINNINIELEIDRRRFFSLKISESGGTIYSGSNLIISTLQPLKKGVILKVNSILPHVKMTDWVSAVTDLGNLVWFYDDQTGTLIVDPKYTSMLPTGEVVQGFYKDAPTEDWEAKVICTNYEGSFKVKDTKKTLLFKFKEDENDTIINGNEYERRIDLNERYPEGVTEFENELFAPTVTRLIPEAIYSDLNEPYPKVPTFINIDPALYTDNGLTITLGNLPEQENENYNRENISNYEMRLGYKIGMVEGSWRYDNGDEENPSGDILTEYPYAAQVDDNHNANIGFANTPLVKGIVSTFYPKDIAIYNYGIIKTIKLSLDKLIVFEKLFRYTKFVNTYYGGQGKFILDNLQFVLNVGGVSTAKLISFDVPVEDI